MLYLSELVIANPDLESFDAFLDVVRDAAREGAMHIHFNIKPPYPDTPENWEDRVEAAFSGRV